MSDFFRLGFHQHVFKRVHQAHFLGRFLGFTEHGAPELAVPQRPPAQQIMNGLKMALQDNRIPQKHKRMNPDGWLYQADGLAASC